MLAQTFNQAEPNPIWISWAQAQAHHIHSHILRRLRSKPWSGHPHWAGPFPGPTTTNDDGPLRRSKKLETRWRQNPSVIIQKENPSKTQMTESTEENDQNTPANPTNDIADSSPPPQQLSKNAQKRLLKQQRYEAKKAERKVLEKEKKKREAERKRLEWEEKLAGVSEEEKAKLIESRRETRKERMAKRSEEREEKVERLKWAREAGQKIVVDLEFSDLMSSSEIHSLVQQIMYCYAVNGRSTSPGHLLLTGCRGEIETQLQRLPGFDKWIIEKESRSYIEVLQDQKENLVYLTADAETVLCELDPKKIYVIGGMVDRNRWKGITLKKANEQGIQSAKLPIGNYLKMSSSQVLTVNQVVEILLKFMETRDWKTSFFQVIPQRKRAEEGREDDEEEDGERKRKCVEEESFSN